MSQKKVPLLYFFKVVLYLLPIISFLSVYISPEKMGWIGFIGLSIPFFIIYSLLGLIFTLYQKKWLTVLIWSAMTIWGGSFIERTFQVSLANKVIADNKIEVLSYNARVFNVYRELRKGEKRKARFQKSKKMLEWLSKDSADIKCIQEYYNYNRSSVFKSTNIISRKGEYYHYVVPRFIDWTGAEFGLAIFSKYPIINHGVINFETENNNGAIYADIKVNSDTIRVLNVHLESMHLKQNILAFTDSIMHYSYEIIETVKRGFSTRATQVDKIYDFIESCPYPYIICGDLNETPYSYTYQKLKSSSKNSFESAGNGFGFTYNGKPTFLRIDNQFYSSDFELQLFQTLRNIDYTDHFPTKALYQLK